MKTARNQGESEITLTNRNGTVRLDGVLHVPEIMHNSLYISSLCDPDNTVLSTEDKCAVKNRNEVVGLGKHNERMYSVELRKEGDKALTTAEGESKLLDNWKQRFAHADRRVIKWMAQNGVVRDMYMSKLRILKDC